MLGRGNNHNNNCHYRYQHTNDINEINNKWGERIVEEVENGEVDGHASARVDGVWKRLSGKLRSSEMWCLRMWCLILIDVTDVTFSLTMFMCVT